MVVMAMLLMSVGVSYARMMQGPPPEAYEVCKGKKVGDECSFTARSGVKVTGKCANVYEEISCLPDNHQIRQTQPRPGGGYGQNQPQ